MPATPTAATGVKTMDRWREFIRSRYSRETQFLNLEVSSCGVMRSSLPDLASAAHA